MPTAPAADQLRLLDVQDADLRLQQAQHRRATLPVIAQIEELSARAVDLEEEAITRGAEVTDLRREVAKAEDDVQAVRSRAERDRMRLESGQGTPKDLQALQSELEVLARRQSDLEDVELEAMERLENAESAQESATQQHRAITEQLEGLRAQLTQEEQAIDAEIGTTRTERDAAATGLDGALMSLYERLRESHGGIGAAALQGATCLGCHMTLNNADVRAIESADPDQVVRCEECGRILVRKAAR